MPLPRPLAAWLAAALILTAAAGAKAEGYNVGSLATPFLQSKILASVLERDDKADAACTDKQFTKADPVRPPETRMQGAVSERRWREIWTVARCGTNVYYMIFFSEMGVGGAAYAIVGPDVLEEIEKYKDAQPAAAPPSQDFLIYFDSGKATLHPDAALTLEAVVKAALARGVPHLVLTGHADTVGGLALNQKLSERRAIAVKEFLVAHGIPAVDITSVGKGKTDLRVPTPDQKREQENRNVHIEIK